MGTRGDCIRSYKTMSTISLTGVLVNKLSMSNETRTPSFVLLYVEEFTCGVNAILTGKLSKYQLI